MKICIAYESKYGNGKKCVEHLQGVISKKGHDVETCSVRETKPGSLPQADVYVFSSPTHVGSPPRKMKKFLKNLEIKQERAKYALIATYMDPKTKTIQKMEEILQETKNSIHHWSSFDFSSGFKFIFLFFSRQRSRSGLV